MTEKGVGDPGVCVGRDGPSPGKESNMAIAAILSAIFLTLLISLFNLGVEPTLVF